MRCNNCGWANPDGLERCQKCNQELDYSLAALESVETDMVEPEILAIVEEKVAAESVAPTESVESTVETSSSLGCPQCGYPVSDDAAECPMCGCELSKKQVEMPRPQESVADKDEHIVNSMKATMAVASVLEAVEREAASKIVETKKTTVVSDEFKKTIIDRGHMPSGVGGEAGKTESDADASHKASLRLKQTVRDISFLSALENQEEKQSSTTQDNIQVEVAQEKRPNFTLTPIDGFVGNLSKLEFAEESVVLNRDNIDKDNATIDAEAQLSIALENGEWYVENLSSLKNTYIVPMHKVKVQSGDIVVIGNRRYIFE